MTQDDKPAAGADDKDADSRKRDSGQPDSNQPDGRPDKVDDQSTVSPGKWVKRIVWFIVLGILLYIAWRISAAYFPRWWADRIGNIVDGRVSVGTMWGLFVGFTFTVIPLLVLFQVRRRFLNWAWRGVIALIAVVLALPNLLTLSVTYGNRESAYQNNDVSSAMQAADRIFDVDGVGFRNASLIGAIGGAVLAFLILFISLRLSGRKKQVKKLQTERDELRRAGAAHDQGEE